MLRGRWRPCGPGRGRPRSLCWYRDPLSYLCHKSKRPCIPRAVAVGLLGPLSRERGLRTIHSEQPAPFLGDGESGGWGWTLSLALPHYNCLWMFPFLWARKSKHNYFSLKWCFRGSGHLWDRVVRTNGRCKQSLNLPAYRRDSLENERSPLGGRIVWRPHKAHSNSCVYLDVPWKSKMLKGFLSVKNRGYQPCKSGAPNFMLQFTHSRTVEAQFCTVLNEFTHHHVEKCSRRRNANDD